MQKPGTKFCWVTRRAKALESQHFSSVLHKWMHAHTEIQWLEAPPNADAGQLSTWLLEKVPVDATAIVFSDKDMRWGGLLVKAVKLSSDARLRRLPVFWVYEDMDHALLDQAVEAQVDNFFHIAPQPDDLLWRMRLTLKQARDAREEAERREVEALKIAKAETILKQREEFLGVCAHDLRSPLGLIQSSLTMALNEKNAKTALSVFQQELLNRAKRQAGQAIALVNDLLDVMSFEQGLKPHYRLWSLDELLTEFHKDYTFQAQQKKVSFHYENPCKTWRVLADSERIRQLLQNLVTNALKFTEEGKNIFLRVESFRGRRKNDPPFPMIVISVRDEGRGIPETEVQRIFDRFAQIKDYARTDGRGLGLTVAKQISTLHDGNIWVESTEGKGSTFFVLFPHTVSRVHIDEPKNKKPTVLIVEPIEERRKKTYEAFEKLGYQLHFIRDGAEAITYSFHMLPDFLILCPDLPKLDGIEVATILKSDVLCANTKIIVAAEPNRQFPPNWGGKVIDKVVHFPITADTVKDLQVVSHTKKAA